MLLRKIVKRLKIIPMSINGIIDRIAHILNIELIFFIKLGLKRKDGKHFIDILLYFLDPVGLPGPYLGRNIIMYANAFGFGKSSNLQVKSGIINQDDYIGVEFQNIVFTKNQVFCNSPYVQYHLNKTHKS